MRDRAEHMPLDMLVIIEDFNAKSPYPLNSRINICTVVGVGAAFIGNE